MCVCTNKRAVVGASGARASRLGCQHCSLTRGAAAAITRAICSVVSVTGSFADDCASLTGVGAAPILDDCPAGAGVATRTLSSGAGGGTLTVVQAVANT